ncbi:hypothetical protein EBZ37_15445, partial [bacterium]|nr:hypothetical protein [bacterium]
MPLYEGDTLSDVSVNVLDQWGQAFDGYSGQITLSVASGASGDVELQTTTPGVSQLVHGSERRFKDKTVRRKRPNDADLQFKLQASATGLLPAESSAITLKAIPSISFASFNQVLKNNCNGCHNATQSSKLIPYTAPAFALWSDAQAEMNWKADSVLRSRTLIRVEHPTDPMPQSGFSDAQQKKTLVDYLKSLDVPSSLVVAEQPTSVSRQTNFTIKVQIKDLADANAIGATHKVSLALLNPPSGLTLTGNADQNAKAGAAEFKNLQLDSTQPANMTISGIKLQAKILENGKTISVDSKDITLSAEAPKATSLAITLSKAALYNGEEVGDVVVRVK